jgi:hypothetical protein
LRDLVDQAGIEREVAMRRAQLAERLERAVVQQLVGLRASTRRSMRLTVCCDGMRASVAGMTRRTRAGVVSSSSAASSGGPRLHRSRRARHARPPGSRLLQRAIIRSQQSVRPSSAALRSAVATDARFDVVEERVEEAPGVGIAAQCAGGQRQLLAQLRVGRGPLDQRSSM